LRGRNGVITRTITVGDASSDVLYDGNSIWVANYLSDTVSKISR
jgi:DNA-binding beta-propeller fold protein YncE